MSPVLLLFGFWKDWLFISSHTLVVAGMERGEWVEEGSGVAVGVRWATEVGVSAVERENSSAGRRMLEVSGETSGDNDGWAASELVSEMVTGLPVGSRGVVRWTGLTEIRVLQRRRADRWAGLQMMAVEVAGLQGVEEDLRPLFFWYHILYK